MRKLFWTCTLCSVTLIGGVISTAHYAVHHPGSIIGRVLHGASYAAGIVNPVSGLGPLASHIRAGDADAADENVENGLADPVPADPEPVLEDPAAAPADEQAGAKTAEAGPIVVADSHSAPIVIRELESAQPYVSLPKDLTYMDTPLSPDGITAATVPTDIECPTLVEAATPQYMPYCEEEECETLPMPTEEPEELPMPRVDEEENGCVGHARQGGVPCGCPKSCSGQCGGDCPFAHPNPDGTPGTAGPTPPTGCPHTACPRSDNTTGKACPATPRGDEEPCEPEHISVRRKLSIFHSQDCDESCPQHPDVDTMEYRSSDRHLYDYGPGSL